MSDKVDRFVYLNKNDPIDLFEIVNKRYEVGKVWVNTSSLYKRFELGKDVKLKKIMSHIQATQDAPSPRGWSQAALEAAAKRSDEWEKYLEDMENAYHAMLDAVNERDAWRSAFEAIRSHNANERHLSEDIC
ncbi:MAG: hypothetical protein KDB74_07070 [Flavobacteriales bacterium]|nr:hypothetical protein [Flavobacteriales bacterium]